MDSGTFAQYFSGVLLTLIGIYGGIRSFKEYRKHGDPVRSFAKTLLVSFILFGVGGGLGVILMVVVSPAMWPLEAISIMGGYLLLAESSLSLLEKLEGYKKGRRKRIQVKGIELPAAGLVTSAKDAEALLRTIATYFKVPILAIGREHPDKWVEKMGFTPSEYIWLTRVEHPQAVNPSSLHVLNGKITKFLEENPGGVVYMEGIEYISFYVDPRSLTKFILSVRDTAIIENGHFILYVTPEVVEPSQFAIFKRELEPINVSEFLDRIQGKALFGALPPAKETKTGGNEGASAEGSKEGSRAGEEEAEEAGPLRRQEKAEEGR